MGTFVLLAFQLSETDQKNKNNNEATQEDILILHLIKIKLNFQLCLDSDVHQKYSSYLIH